MQHSVKKWGERKKYSGWPEYIAPSWWSDDFYLNLPATCFSGPRPSAPGAHLCQFLILEFLLPEQQWRTTGLMLFLLLLEAGLFWKSVFVLLRSGGKNVVVQHKKDFIALQLSCKEQTQSFCLQSVTCAISAVFPQFLSGVVGYAARMRCWCVGAKKVPGGQALLVVVRFHARFMQTAFSSAIIERLFLMEMF